MIRLNCPNCGNGIYPMFGWDSCQLFQTQMYPCCCGYIVYTYRYASGLVEVWDCTGLLHTEPSKE